MAHDKLVLNPTTRTLITEIEPNNNAVTILEPRVFDASPLSCSLSVTEPIDTGALTAGNIITSILSSTDTIDTLYFTVNAIIALALSQTDGIDTGAFTGTGIVSGELDTTEQTDVVDFHLIGGAERNAQLNVTEAIDTALIRVRQRTVSQPTQQGGGSSSYIVPRVEKPIEHNASLSVSEQADTITAHAKSEITIAMSISERADSAIVGTFGNHKKRYEMDEILFLLRVA